MCNASKIKPVARTGINLTICASAVPLLYYLMLYTLESSIYVKYGKMAFSQTSKSTSVMEK